MKNLSVLLSPQTVKNIHQAHLFIVGVGGIGCELLKILPRVGFRKFTILDLDIIQLSNLNRQFYFRQEDIKKSKAEVAKYRLQMLDPNLQITAICDSIYKNDYNVEFYRQFDAVIAAIDTERGRAHVGMMCIRAGIPLVDGGTKSYQGQTQSVIRHISRCHNCVPVGDEHQNFQACTLRNKPERPVHCIVYAKEFYNNFFGEHDFGDIKKEEFVKGNQTEQELMQVVKNVFNALFDQRVEERADKIEISGVEKPKVKRNPQIHYLTFEDALKKQDILSNPPSTISEEQAREQQKSLYERNKLWSLKTCAQKFFQSMFRTLKQLQKNPKSLQFQKDDQDSMTIVYVIATIRTFNFMNRQNPKNAHKYLSFYSLKQRAGSITPAISSTNSIAAATQVSQLLKIFQKRHHDLKYVSYHNSPVERVYKGELSRPLANCLVCSIRYCHVQLRCDFRRTTLQQVYDYLQENMGYGRDLEAMNAEGTYVTIVSPAYKQKLKENLIDLEGIVAKNQSIDMQLNPDDLTPLCLNLFVKHDEGRLGIRKIGDLDVGRSVLDYKRIQYKETWQERRMELEEYGWVA